MATQVEQDPRDSGLLGFDPESLVAKYREERSKRLRSEGIYQFRHAEGGLQHYADDPHVHEIVHRDAIDEGHEVLIIGGGWGGILAAVQLYDAGIKDIKIVEKGSDFGGVWYWNQYPGAQCDTEAFIYLPLLEQMGYIPTSKYVRDPEIRGYARKIGQRFELYPKALFQTEMLSLNWDEENAQWTGNTNRGDSIKAKFVISCIGLLHKLHLPGIPGIEDYKGHSFHTSRWDYKYTGGDSNGYLTKLTDKRVAMIGTGATAVQSVPFLGKWAKDLYIFQRTPSSIDENMNKPTDHEFVKKLITEPGWQERRQKNFNILVGGGYQEEDLVGDRWTTIFGNLPQPTRDSSKETTPEEMQEMGKRMQMVDFQAMEGIRRRIDEIVKDKKTAEALKPWYNRMCKRPCFHNDYLPTFNLPNVHLVDTNGKGVERITEKGIQVNGKEYKVDLIIYATGFDIGTDYSDRGNLTIHGRNGLTLKEKWKSGPFTFHGMTTRDFPNYLIISHIQATATPNYMTTLQDRAKHATYLTEQVKKRGLRTIEPTEEAEREWTQTILDTSGPLASYFKECTPGYFNAEGMLTPELGRSGTYGVGGEAFFDLMEGWRKADKMEGLDLGRATGGKTEMNGTGVNETT